MKQEDIDVRRHRHVADGQLLVGGKWLDASGGERMAVVSLIACV
jgi:hypothetical protein